ncbi:E1b 19K [Simian adenovirus 20]|uniref:E1B protein, small T-antigen n=1 Tax=Simian adenovirus 20 TaxID=585059 RepID=F6KST6_9ADEN|nr:E1b 19K [Simian adenovirus 20]AEF59041.1 E1b 19K [Simian adenovirus 20]
MDLYESLENLGSLRRLLEEASDRTSYFWRFLCGSPLSRFLNRVKREHRAEFDELLEHLPGLFDSLNLGHRVLLEERLFPQLDFSSPGRLCSALAFVVHLLDRWNEQTQLSPGYTLDFLTLCLWKFGIRKGRKLYRRLVERHPSLRQHRLQAQALLRQEELETILEEEAMNMEEQNPRAGLDPPVEA